MRCTVWLWEFIYSRAYCVLPGITSSGTNAVELCGDGLQIDGHCVSRLITCMLHCLVMLACRCMVRKIGLPLQKLSIACSQVEDSTVRRLSGTETYTEAAIKAWRSLLDFTAEQLQNMLPSVDLLTSNRN